MLLTNTLKHLLITAIIFLSINQSTSVTIECRRADPRCHVKKLTVKARNEAITNVIKSHPQTTELMVKNAQVSYLPMGIGDFFQYLKVLQVSSSKLEEIEKKNFENLKNLIEIDLSQNLIKILPDDCFEDLEEILKINLSGNKILQIPSSIFVNNKKASKIFLANNQISQIYSETFKNLKELKILDLAFNKIEALESGTFDENKNVEEILLSSNKLKKIPENIFAHNLNLKIDEKYFKDNECIDRKFDDIDELNEIFRTSCKACSDEEIKSLKNEVLELTKLKNQLEKKIEGILDSKDEEMKKLKDELKNQNTLNSGYKITIKHNMLMIGNLTERIENLTLLNEELRKMPQIEVEEMKVKNLKIEEKLENCYNDRKKLNEDLNVSYENYENIYKKLNLTLDEKNYQKSQNKLLMVSYDHCSENLAISNETLFDVRRKLKNVEDDNLNLLNNLSEANEKIAILTTFEATNKKLDKQLEACKFLLKTDVSDDKVEFLVEKCSANNLKSDCNDCKKEVKNGKAKVKELSERVSMAENNLRNKEESCRRIEENNQRLMEEMREGRRSDCDRVGGGNKSMIIASPTPSPQAFTTITCDFIDFKFKGGERHQNTFYTCKIFKFTLIDCATKIIDLTGAHQSERSNLNVTGVQLISTHLNEFPEIVFSEYYLNYLEVINSGFGTTNQICDNNLRFLIVKSSFIGESLMVENCQNLKTLTVESSKLKKISLDNLEKVESLSLRDNEIDQISSNSFNSMKSLMFLQLSKNKLTELDGKLLTKNSNLQIVILTENPLKYVDETVFDKKSNLKQVKMENCGCIDDKVSLMGNRNDFDRFKENLREKCNKISNDY